MTKQQKALDSLSADMKARRYNVVLVTNSGQVYTATDMTWSLAVLFSEGHIATGAHIAKRMDDEGARIANVIFSSNNRVEVQDIQSILFHAIQVKAGNIPAFRS